MTSADEVAARTIGRHFETFCSLRSDALRSLERGRPVAAAVQTQIAANHAFFHHGGIWSSPELEQLLVTIGRDHIEPGSIQRQPSGGGVERVLHVATRVTGIGGHSRMLWRWIAADDRRRHSVVLTRQGAQPVPEALEDAAEGRYGRVHTLNLGRGDVLSWAQDLRELAEGFDIVIMHVFAEDVIPLIAFADRRGLPPILFVDQADHAFSLGAASSDLYVGLRDAGAELAVQRRHVDPSRVAGLPITITPQTRTTPRDKAKELLGRSPDEVMFLSIARAPKFRPYRGEQYFEAFLDVLARHENASLVVIGPNIDGDWRRAVENSGGQVEVFPERPDTQLFYEAADVYVDSYPVISNTSLLEAGSYGLPLLSRCLHPGPHTIYCAGAPGFATQIDQAVDRSAFVGSLDWLILDDERRRQVGRDTSQAIESLHVGPGWLAALEQLYERAATIDPLLTAPAGSDNSQHERVDLLWPELFDSDVTTDDIASWFVKGLPLDLRMITVAKICANQRRLRPQLLFPEWVTGRLRSLDPRALLDR